VTLKKKQFFFSINIVEDVTNIVEEFYVKMTLKKTIFLFNKFPAKTQPDFRHYPE
jgi:hypothetical protein